jgi:hypothetical protein
MMDTTYSDYQKEMDLFTGPLEIMAEVRARRIMTFPIPTSISPRLRLGQPEPQGTRRYGEVRRPYFSNSSTRHGPEDARSCLPPRIDKASSKCGRRPVRRSPLTQRGVVTINTAPGPHLQERQDSTSAWPPDDIAATAWDQSQAAGALTASNLYPYTHLLPGAPIKDAAASNWKNHFSTNGLLGMNERASTCWSVITPANAATRSPARLDFSSRLIIPKDTGNNYNLEATPAKAPPPFAQKTRDASRLPRGE